MHQKCTTHMQKSNFLNGNRCNYLTFHLFRQNDSFFSQRDGSTFTAEITRNTVQRSAQFFRPVTSHTLVCAVLSAGFENLASKPNIAGEMSSAQRPTQSLKCNTHTSAIRTRRCLLCAENKLCVCVSNEGGIPIHAQSQPHPASHVRRNRIRVVGISHTLVSMRKRSM